MYTIPELHECLNHCVMWSYICTTPRSSEIPIEEKETEKQETTAAVEKEIEEKKPGCDFNIYVISEESSHTGEARQQMTGDR